MNIQLLNKKRSQEKEDSGSESEELNFNELIDSAFKYFLKGENDKFVRNLEALESNKNNTKFNLVNNKK